MVLRTLIYYQIKSVSALLDTSNSPSFPKAIYLLPRIIVIMRGLFSWDNAKYVEILYVLHALAKIEVFYEKIGTASFDEQ